MEEIIMKRQRVNKTQVRRFGIAYPHRLNNQIGYRGGERK